MSRGGVEDKSRRMLMADPFPEKLIVTSANRKRRWKVSVGPGKILSAIELYFDQNDGVWNRLLRTPEQFHPRWNTELLDDATSINLTQSKELWSLNRLAWVST